MFASERNRVFVEQFVARAADAGLVTDDEPIGRRRFIGPEPRQWENSGDKLELVRAMDIAVIHMDHGVTIEKLSAAVHGPRVGFVARADGRS